MFKKILNFRRWLFCPWARKWKWEWLFKKSDCFRYEKSIEICDRSGWIEGPWCPKTTEKYFFPWSTNKPGGSCDVCQPVTANICIDTGLLANEYCERTEEREYKKGSQPFMHCGVHKGKPPIPKPEKIKCREDLSYQKTGILYTEQFDKDCLIAAPVNINRMRFGELYADRAKHDRANFIRTFFTYNAGAPLHDQHLHPHPIVKGKWDIENINPDWYNQVCDGLDFLIGDLNFTVAIILLDQGSFNRWGSHYLNRTNNHRFMGKETYYDHYGGTKCFTLYDDFQKVKDGGMTEEERESYETTRSYFLWFWDTTVAPLKMKFGNKLLVWNNEIDGGDTFHSRVADIFQEYGFKKAERFTSVRGPEWPFNKKSIGQKWILDIHGVKKLRMTDLNEQDPNLNKIWQYEEWMKYYSSKEEAKAVKGEIFTNPAVINADGWGWCSKHTGKKARKYCVDDREEVRALAKKVLADGNKGVSGNIWFNKAFDLSDLDPETGDVLRDTVIEHLESR